MAARFVTVDRDTPMLLPPSLQDWVPEDHLVHFIIDAVEPLDLRHARVNERGSGSKQYPPATMLALLAYGYATGGFAGRRIEQSTFDNVAVRYRRADTHPDHEIPPYVKTSSAGRTAHCWPTPSRRSSSWPRAASSSGWATSPWPATARSSSPTPADTARSATNAPACNSKPDPIRHRRPMTPRAPSGSPTAPPPSPAAPATNNASKPSNRSSASSKQPSASAASCGADCRRCRWNGRRCAAPTTASASRSSKP